MYAVLTLIGIGLFTASIVLEPKAARDAEGAPVGYIIPMRGAGIVAATVGLVAMCILAAVAGGFFNSPPAV